MSLTNAIDNNALSALSKQAGPKITKAVYNASKQTGVDFAYLMEKASAESSFDADAKSKTSSATGLFQFIDSTWIGMVKKHGDKYGLSDIANYIDNNGKVNNSDHKKEILELRKDPQTAALLAAEYAADNKKHLIANTSLTEKDIGSTELYFAHFMGAGGATSFMNELEQSPNDIAATHFPAAAKANRNVFYNHKTGAARTVQEVYDFFDKKFKSDDVQTQAIETTVVAGAQIAKPAQSTYTPSFSIPDFSPMKTDPIIMDFITHPLIRMLNNDATQSFLHRDDRGDRGDRGDDKYGNKASNNHKNSFISPHNHLSASLSLILQTQSA